MWRFGTGMETAAFLRRTTIGLAASLLAGLLMVELARASEITAATPATAFRIHGPQETLRDYCQVEDGVLWLVLPGGARFELVTSVDDPVIANRGDGTFHSFEIAEVRAALDAVTYPLEGVCADVFLLPFPRRAGLQSAAGPGLILLSPGVRPLTREHQHAEFVHELGHVVQYVRLPDPDESGWARYREIRGIADLSVYNASGVHADRPHEIFAEDFRALFGGAVANYSGTIENAELAHPRDVPGLAEFMRSLAPAAAAAVTPAIEALACHPNPAAGPVRFTRAAGPATPLDVFDLAGRRVATLEPTTGNGVVSWTWDGRDPAGSAAGTGVYFARPRDGSGPGARVTRIR
jgi:hypothetical protein